MFRNSDVETGAGLESSSLSDATKTNLSTTSLKDWPLHPILFGGLYVLVSFSQVYPLVNFWELAKCLVPILVVFSLIQFVIWRSFPSHSKGAILSSLFIVVFCFFGDWRMQLQRVLLEARWAEFTRLRYLLTLALLICFVISWFVVGSKRTWATLNRYLNVLSTTLIILAVIRIPAIPPVPAVPIGAKAHTPLLLPKNPPDVYFILADAYTSAESLKKFWNYDNAPFLDFLKQAGFRVIENAHGNSDFTPRCLSTYLNMDYPPKLPPAFGMSARVTYLCNVIQNAEAPARFKASGYKIMNWSIFSTGGEPAFYSFPILGSTRFIQFLIDKTLFGYIEGYLNKMALGGKNIKIISQLSAIAQDGSRQPKFIYAHLLMPHEPFLFDRNGKRILRGMSMAAIRKEDYLDQLIYENTLLTNVVSNILKYSKTPPIIIIQGDHGFRHLPENHAEESTTILNALYLPGAKDDWIYKGMTPVNTFRMIFNNYFDENYEYRPDTQQLYFAEHE